MTMLHEWPVAAARRTPDAVALVQRDVRLSYGELESGSNRIARALIRAGCRRGDRVALLLPKSPTAVTAMIGVLKALGSTSWSIQRIFILHAARIITIGLVIGNLLGLTICLLQQRFKIITLNEADYYLSYAPVDLNLWFILALNLGTIVVILTFLLIPSFLVTRIDPVRTIRFK